MNRFRSNKVGHAWTRNIQSPLHALLSAKLPDLTDRHGVCIPVRLAEAMNVSVSSVVKWLRSAEDPRKKVPLSPDRVDQIIALSKRQVTGGPDFVPATRMDFWNHLWGSDG